MFTVAQCLSYRVLQEVSRNQHSSESIYYCDDEDHDGDWRGPGWYRMMSPAGTQIPEYPPSSSHCGTHATGWLNGTHPSIPFQSVSREICFNWNDDMCNWKTNITITNCQDYFVYDLKNTPGCTLRYCAEFSGRF